MERNSFWKDHCWLFLGFTLLSRQFLGLHSAGTNNNSCLIVSKASVFARLVAFGPRRPTVPLSFLIFLIAPILISEVIPLVLSEPILPLVVAWILFCGRVWASFAAIADLSLSRSWHVRVPCLRESFFLIIRDEQPLVRPLRFVDTLSVVPGSENWFTYFWFSHWLGCLVAPVVHIVNWVKNFHENLSHVDLPVDLGPDACHPFFDVIIKSPGVHGIYILFLKDTFIL